MCTFVRSLCKKTCSNDVIYDRIKYILILHPQKFVNFSLVNVFIFSKICWANLNIQKFRRCRWYLLTLEVVVKKFALLLHYVNFYSVTFQPNTKISSSSENFNFQLSIEFISSLNSFLTICFDLRGNFCFLSRNPSSLVNETRKSRNDCKKSGLFDPSVRQ